MIGGHVIRPKYRRNYRLYQLAIYKKDELKKFANMFRLFGRKQIILDKIKKEVETSI